MLILKLHDHDKTAKQGAKCWNSSNKIFVAKFQQIIQQKNLVATIKRHIQVANVSGKNY